jgi:hypothetical protein
MSSRARLGLTLFRYGIPALFTIAGLVVLFTVEERGKRRARKR